MTIVTVLLDTFEDRRFRKLPEQLIRKHRPAEAGARWALSSQIHDSRPAFADHLEHDLHIADASRRKRAMQIIEPAIDLLDRQTLPVDEATFGGVLERLGGEIEKILAHASGEIPAAEARANSAETNLRAFAAGSNCDAVMPMVVSTDGVAFMLAAAVGVEAIPATLLLGSEFPGGWSQALGVSVAIGVGAWSIGVLTGWAWQKSWQSPVWKTAVGAMAVSSTSLLVLAASAYRVALVSGVKHPLVVATDALVHHPFDGALSLVNLVLSLTSAAAVVATSTMWLRIYTPVPGYRPRRLLAIATRRDVDAVVGRAEDAISQATEEADDSAQDLAAKSKIRRRLAEASLTRIYGALERYRADLDRIKKAWGAVLGRFCEAAAKTSRGMIKAPSPPETIGVALPVNDPAPAVEAIVNQSNALLSQAGSVARAIHQIGAAGIQQVRAIAKAAADGRDLTMPLSPPHGGTTNTIAGL